MTLRLAAVLAHPDDESLGLGGTLAHYAAQGVETFLVTATRGERGRFFDNDNRPSDTEVGRVREGELRAAAVVLGIREVTFLDYIDRDLDSAPHGEVIGRIVRELRRIRPQVVLTFGPDGAYGHPDHIAISQFTLSAVVAAADPAWGDGEEALGAAHTVVKVYQTGLPARIWKLYQTAFKRLVSTVDGEEREATPWPEWMLRTRIDARQHWETVWRAIRKHETQLAVYQGLDDLTREQHEVMWGEQYFCRVLSLVNGGRRIETDLFEGLR